MASKALLNDLIDARARGVDVFVYLDPRTPPNPISPQQQQQTIDRLAKSGRFEVGRNIFLAAEPVIYNFLMVDQLTVFTSQEGFTKDIVNDQGCLMVNDKTKAHKDLAIMNDLVHNHQQQQ
jgi:hypothetical protein